MANLNFKWGVHSKLPKSVDAADIGTLFFTKDERSLYLGAEAGKAPKRIQGVVQYYADLTAFKSDVLPPYSSDVIYYIASENALVRWDGNKVNEDGEAEGRFVVLNVTASEFDTAVSGMEADILANAGNIGTNTTAITGLRTDLGNTNDTADKATAFGRIADLEAAVAALEELTGAGSGDNSLSSRIGALETWMTTAKGEIGKLQTDMLTAQGSISSHGTKIGTLETTVGEHGTKINAAESKITALENADDGIKSRLDQAEKDIDDNTDGISANARDILALQGTVGGHTTSIEGLVTRMGTAEGAIDDLEELTGQHTTKISEAEGDIKALEDRALAFEGNIDTVDADLIVAAGVANAASAAVGTKTDDKTKETAFGRIAALAEEDTAIKNAAEALAGRVTAAEGTITKHGTRLGTVETDLGTAKADILSLQGAVAKKVETETFNALAGRVTDVETKNDQQDTAIGENANAITGINNKLGNLGDKTVAAQFEAVSADILAANGEISKHAESIAGMDAVVKGHTGDISAFNGEIATIKNTDTQQNGRLDALETFKTSATKDLSKAGTDILALDGRMGAAEKKFENYYTKSEADTKHNDLKTELNNKIDGEINAANSLKYIGGIANDTAWNAIKAADSEIGAAYVVTDQHMVLNINGDNVTCYAGDLLIATAANPADEVDGVLPAEKTIWVHVKAGYQQELESELRVIDGDADAAKKATVQLTSYPSKQAGVYGDLGAFSVVADSKNLEVAVDGSNIKISMVWDSFGE